MLAALSLLVLGLDLPPEAVHHVAERDYRPASEQLAYGELKGELDDAKRVPWPVKVLSIGHTIASYQNYEGRGLPQGPYFHHGLDIRADAGSNVYAARGGKVVNIENYVPGNNLYWEISILDDDGFLWQYHHVNRNSIPSYVKQAFEEGTRLDDHVRIGSVVQWPIVSFGERYNHIHLNVLGKDKTYLNPFAFLERLKDDVPPEIVEIGLLQNGRRVEGVKAGAPYTLFAEVSDLILSDKFLVPANSLSMTMGEGMPAVIWNFEMLPGGTSNTAFVHDFFVPGKSCGNYQCRKLVVNLGFHKDTKQVFPDKAGKYKVRLDARDFEGNLTTKTFEWSVD